MLDEDFYSTLQSATSSATITRTTVQRADSSYEPTRRLEAKTATLSTQQRAIANLRAALTATTQRTANLDQGEKLHSATHQILDDRAERGLPIRRNEGSAGEGRQPGRCCGGARRSWKERCSSDHDDLAVATRQSRRWVQHHPSRPRRQLVGVVDGMSNGIRSFSTEYSLCR